MPCEHVVVSYGEQYILLSVPCLPRETHDAAGTIAARFVPTPTFENSLRLLETPVTVKAGTIVRAPTTSNISQYLFAALHLCSGPQLISYSLQVASSSGRIFTFLTKSSASCHQIADQTNQNVYTEHDLYEASSKDPTPLQLSCLNGGPASYSSRQSSEI